MAKKYHEVQESMSKKRKSRRYTRVNKTFVCVIAILLICSVDLSAQSIQPHFTEFKFLEIRPGQLAISLDSSSWETILYLGSQYWYEPPPEIYSFLREYRRYGLKFSSSQWSYYRRGYFFIFAFYDSDLTVEEVDALYLQLRNDPKVRSAGVNIWLDSLEIPRDRFDTPGFTARGHLRNHYPESFDFLMMLERQDMINNHC